MNHETIAQSIALSGFRKEYEHYRYGDVYKKVNGDNVLYIINIPFHLITSPGNIKKVKESFLADYRCFANSIDNVMTIVEVDRKKDVKKIRRSPNTIVVCRNYIKTYGISKAFGDVKNVFFGKDKIDGAIAKKALAVIGDIEVKNAFPVFTYAILISCIVLFVKHVSSVKYGVTPESIFKDQQYFRLVTSMFLHNNLAHIIGNMLALFFAGRSLEKVFGHTTFLLTYFVGGVYSMLTSIYYYNIFRSSQTNIIGASGAIFAVMGALIVGRIYNRDKYGAIYSIFLASILLFASFGMESVANIAHASGLLFGIATMSAWLLAQYTIRNMRYLSASRTLRKYGEDVLI